MLFHFIRKRRNPFIDIAVHFKKYPAFTALRELDRLIDDFSFGADRNHGKELFNVSGSILMQPWLRHWCTVVGQMVA